jgi:hypothetical protein
VPATSSSGDDDSFVYSDDEDDDGSGSGCVGVPRWLYDRREDKAWGDPATVPWLASVDGLVELLDVVDKQVEEVRVFGAQQVGMPTKGV